MTFRYNSLQVKIIAPLALLIVAIAGFNSLYFSHHQAQLIDLAFYERMKKMADIITLGTGIALGSGDLEVARATVDLLEEDRDLAFMLIFKGNVELIRHGDVDRTRLDRNTLLGLPEGETRKLGDYLVRRDRIVYKGEQLGLSLIGLRVKDREQAIAESLRITLLMSLLISAAGIGVILVLSQILVIRPVLHLGRVAERIAGGDLSPEIAPYNRRDDEIGQLYTSFNTMVEKLRAATEHLQEQVQARTAALQVSEAQLERQNRELARLNTYKSHLLSVVSHELKTPLASLDGFSRLINQMLLTDAFLEQFAGAQRETLEKVRHRIEIMAHNTSRLTHLLNDLLDFSRIDRGQGLEMNQQLVNLDRLVRETVETYAEVAAKKGLVVRYEEVSEGLWAVADGDRIVQVLDNLLNNALKFTESGEGIRVTAHYVGDYLEFQVRDSGEGIEPRALERIFEMFEQAGSTPSRKQGTGIGLAISRYIVERHNGYIRAESAGLGKGSCFLFGIPRYKGPAGDGKGSA